MTSSEYLKLSSDLQKLEKITPLQWGRVQNDRTDKQIRMFQIHSYEELEKRINLLSDNEKNYFRRRWFLWKCAQCDEHIFCMNDNVSPNLNTKDQAYDIEFNENADLRFDVKGTVIPKNFRNKIDSIIENPTEMVNFYFEKQSKGVRNHIQNRLFIVHHSFVNQAREMHLRCQWNYKENVFSIYSRGIRKNSNFIKFRNVKADVIFILENPDKAIRHQFYAIL